MASIGGLMADSHCDSIPQSAHGLKKTEIHNKANESEKVLPRSGEISSMIDKSFTVIEDRICFR